MQLGIKHNIPTPYNKVLKEMVEIIHKSQDLKQSSKVLTAIGK